MGPLTSTAYPMNASSLTRRTLLASLASFPLAWSKSWDHPVFPHWDGEFLDRMLTDSPWARRVSVSFLQPAIQRTGSNFGQIGIPGTGSPIPTIPGINWPRNPRSGTGTGGRSPSGTSSNGVKAIASLTVRWATALPIRQAMALQEFGPAGLETAEARKELEPSADEYVIQIAGFPVEITGRDAKRVETDLRNSARLSLPGHGPLVPLSVEVPEFGMHLMATLHFRRGELPPADGAIDLHAASGPIKIDQQFKLRPMVYAGRLEL